MKENNEFIPANVPSTFYERLKELTSEQNLNYGQLAAKMDFPSTYIYEWIKENTLPPLSIFWRCPIILRYRPTIF